MTRTAVNPWDWSLQFGFNQGELIEGGKRVLYCSGQTCLDENAKPQHVDDIRGQITASLDNLEAVLAKADMSLSNVVRLTVYTTDIDAMLQNFDALVARLDAAGVKPAQTLLGVARLAFPELLVELEAAAID
jgi:enamine deaminase RidA (YjgF/YER057c/UK114 family)